LKSLLEGGRQESGLQVPEVGKTKSKLASLLASPIKRAGRDHKKYSFFIFPRKHRFTLFEQGRSKKASKQAEKKKVESKNLA
jgi:hypothetical protein